MVSKHEISEYIDNLPLQPTFCKGYRPDEVYEVICNISSMYNQLLSETMLENEELKLQLDCQKSTSFDEVKQMISEKEEINIDLSDSKSEENEFFDVEDKKQEAENQIIRTMTDKELQRLKRGDLLELLLGQSKENDVLKKQMEKKDKEICILNNKLHDRKIELEKAGTIAEASFHLNGVYKAAEKAAQQYLDNLQRLYEKQEQLYSVKEAEVEANCSELLKKTKEQCEEAVKLTEEQCAAREKEAEDKCAYLEQKAKTDVDRRWNELSKKLEDFYEAHNGLRELLASAKMI